MSERRLIGSDWTWVTDYVYAYSRWTLSAEHGRDCEVGMGVKVLGRPRGQRKRFRDYVQFTTIGIGAVHVRTRDGRGPCMVQLDQGEVKPITVTVEGLE